MIRLVKLNSDHMQSEATSTIVSEHVYLELRLKLTRLSLGQDLQVTRDLTKDRMKGKKRKGGGGDYRRKGEFIQWTPTLMLLWYSRTLLRAKT